MTRSSLGAAATALAIVLATGACARGPRPAAVSRMPSPSSPPRPAPCTEVTPAEPLQSAIDAAPPGGALCLAPGTYPGPIRLDRGVALWGPPEAVVLSNGKGNTVSMRGAGSRLLGLTIRGSGNRFDLVDAGVNVSSAEDARVEGIHVLEATFGIVVEQSKRVVVRGNEIVGSARTSLGMRGDAVRLWETEDSLVEGNHIRDSRDVVVWFSPRNRIERNRVEGSRYGTHLMYARDAIVANNRYVRNEVGVFVMYSRVVRIEGNLLGGANGAGGMGLGLKEAGNVVARGNDIIQNTIGLYVDTSPLNPSDFNSMERNVFRLDGTAIVFHSSPKRMRFDDNSFRDNGAQVRVDGGGDALGIEWARNDWDDYRGYDLDRDGVGDVPYELRSLSNELRARYPNLAFFDGSPTLALVEAAGHVVPIFEPRTLVRDPLPRMRALPIGVADAH